MLEFRTRTAGAREQRSQYLVSQLRGRGQTVEDLARECSKALGVPTIPWAAVAARLPSAAGQAWRLDVAGKGLSAQQGAVS